MIKVLIRGLNQAGKTTLAKALLQHLDAVHVNADVVRNTISKDLGFSHEDRVKHATRMSQVCDIIVASGKIALADFVCPTEETQAAFGADLTIVMNTISTTKYEDTQQLYRTGDSWDIQVTSFDYDVLDIAKDISKRAKIDVRKKNLDLEAGKFDWNIPTSILIGRYQPFHDGHYGLVQEALKRTPQACLAVRSTTGTPGNPFMYSEVVHGIREKFIEREGSFNSSKIHIMQLPNITKIIYGRDVGYSIEKVELDPELQKVSATAIRKQLGIS